MMKPRIPQELRLVIAFLRRAHLRPSEVQKLLQRAGAGVSRAHVYRLYNAAATGEVQL